MMLDIKNSMVDKEVIANADRSRGYAGLKRLVNGMKVGETKLVDVKGRVNVDKAIIDLYGEGFVVRTTQLDILRWGEPINLSKPVYLSIEMVGRIE
ncbi:MAG: hypothetical protein AABX65_01955 [Nanoarchaeota archaeon]